MKFKKDGEVFDDIEVIRARTCGGHSCSICGDCPLTEAVQGLNCIAWCKANPAEAARLMGYEVVDDDKDINVTCRWYLDEICVNGDSPMCADYCPVPDTPGVCRHDDREESQHSGNNTTTSEEEWQEVKKEHNTMTRETILNTAKQCVCGEREQDYGSPENNFQVVANLWIDYLSGKGSAVDISPKDVAVMLALLKIARISSGNAKADNWVDLAGYAACGGEIEAKES